MPAGHAGDASQSRRLRRCGSRYRQWSQQLQNGSPGHPRVKVTFDEIRLRRCHFRHMSTPCDQWVRARWLKSTGWSCSMASYRRS
ncbi:hypothetical protein EQH50_24525 [Klebsiella quasipneumoniae]|nr:hypothetical protein EQH50_24525 [Klebsiella quasipneumoniae]